MDWTDGKVENISKLISIVPQTKTKEGKNEEEEARTNFTPKWAYVNNCTGIDPLPARLPTWLNATFPEPAKLFWKRCLSPSPNLLNPPQTPLNHWGYLCQSCVNKLCVCLCPGSTLGQDWLDLVFGWHTSDLGGTLRKVPPCILDVFILIWLSETPNWWAKSSNRWTWVFKMSL